MKRKASTENDVITKLHKLMTDKGIESLLPHNLPDDLFQDVIQYIDNAKKDDLPVNPLTLMLVLYFNGYNGNNQMEVGLEGIYVGCSTLITNIFLESLRRAGTIDFEPLPTVSTLLNAKSVIKVHEVNQVITL